MKRAFRRPFMGILLGLVVGCGDTNLFEGRSDQNAPAAVLEAAQIAIDNGEFTSAITLLEQLCGTNLSVLTCDAETAALMASAYAGRAGLNVFDLIQTAANLPAGTTGSFASFSTLFSAPTVNNKSDLHVAVSILANLPSLSANQGLELAVMAMADVVVTTGVDLTSGFDPTTGLPNVQPTLTDVQNAQTTNGTVTQVSDDLACVVQGVAASGLTTPDIVDDLTQVQGALDANLDGAVSDAELQAFLGSL